MSTPKKSGPNTSQKKAAADNVAVKSKHRIPLVALPVTAVVTLLVSFFMFSRFPSGSACTESDNTEMREAEDAVNHVRLKSRRFTAPLLLTDLTEESPEFASLRERLSRFIDQKKTNGELLSASVYVRRLQTDEWFSINPDETFRPASMLKLPVLITFLKLAEEEPNVLKLPLLNNLKPSSFRNQTFTDSTIVPGKAYTVQELLERMIRFSDNEATSLVQRLLTGDQFDRVFLDLGLKAPPHKDLTYAITAADYSRFLRVLFNATYLDERQSEYALNLLSKASFRQGLSLHLPADVTVAHKFGESFMNGSEMFHDSGIVYAGNDPYLITVMTKGSDPNVLSNVIADISKQVYDYWSQPKAG